MNGADGISDIEGKATRVGASERGQRTSFNALNQLLILVGSSNREQTDSAQLQPACIGSDAGWILQRCSGGWVSRKNLTNENGMLKV